MFKVISDIMAHCYDTLNTTTVVMNCCTFYTKNMIGALMIIISNHNGIKCLSNLLQLEPRNDMFKVISGTLL